MPPPSISFQGAKRFKILGGNFGKIEGDSKTVNVHKSKPTSSNNRLTSAQSEPHDRRRSRSSARSVPTGPPPTRAPPSPVSSAASFAPPATEDENETAESDAASVTPPISLENHLPCRPGSSVIPPRPAPPPTRESHVPSSLTSHTPSSLPPVAPSQSTPMFGSSASAADPTAEGLPNTSIPSHRTHSLSSRTTSVHGQTPLIPPRPNNPEPFQRPGAPPSSTHTGQSPRASSVRSNVSTFHSPPSSRNVPSGTYRSQEPDSARQPTTDRHRCTYIHSRPLPPIPESRRAANEETISHTPPSWIAHQTTLPFNHDVARRFDSPSYTPRTVSIASQSAIEISVSRNSATPGGMLDQHYLIGGPYPQTFAEPPYSVLDFGLYSYHRAPLDVRSPYPPFTAPFAVTAQSAGSHINHSRWAQPTQPPGQQMPYSSPDFGIPFQNFGWAGSGAAFGRF